MLETLKASLFLFSLSLSFPLYRKKPHPFLPLEIRLFDIKFYLRRTREREREESRCSNPSLIIELRSFVMWF